MFSNWHSLFQLLDSDCNTSCKNYTIKCTRMIYNNRKERFDLSFSLKKNPSFLYIANNIIFLQLSPLQLVQLRLFDCCLHPVSPFVPPSIPHPVAALSPLSPLTVRPSFYPFSFPLFFLSLFRHPIPSSLGMGSNIVGNQAGINKHRRTSGLSLELAQYHGEMSRVHHGQAESERRDA